MAEKTAAAILDSGRMVTDADVLRLLRQWAFRKNKSRRNVLPPGSDFVESDTLGIVATRDGRVCLSKPTRKHANCFKLLAQWLQSNGPCVGRDFAFTSINVNGGYAARAHRDSGNRGPSITKAFGVFSGGALSYWPEDDGALQLEDVTTYPSCTVDTQAAVVLFDGNRCHSVEPFLGERYSLVFFTQSHFSRAPKAELVFLDDNGLGVPTEGDLRFFAGLLAPPKGYGRGAQQQTIRRCLGLAEKPQAISYKTAVLLDTGDALTLILSFVLQVTSIDTLSAVSPRFDSSVHDPASWRNVRVDTAGFRPAGLAAHGHWKLWRFAYLVVVNPWMHMNMGLLMHKRIKCWRWVGNSKFRVVRGHHVLTSQLPVHAAAVNMLVAGRASEAVEVVVANTRDPYEILECLDGEPREGRFCFSAVFTDAPQKGAFAWNAEVLGGNAPPLAALYGFLSLSLFMGKLQLTIDGVIMAVVMTNRRLPADDYFGAIVAAGNKPPEIEAIPCWSTAD